MNVKKILDSIYVVPIVLEHLEKPTDLTAKILMDIGLVPEDLRELKKIKHLLQYHQEMIRYEYVPNYPLLRKGLKEYFNSYLSDIFKKLDIVNREVHFLDYGCGDGQFTKQFLKDNPLSNTLMVDRELSTTMVDGDNQGICVIDFERNPNWYLEYENEFDVILISEVLHCKNKEGQRYLIDSAYKMLKKKGRLIIVENIDYIMEYRIRKLKPDTDVHVVTGYNIFELVKIFSNLVLHKSYNINRHFVYDYKKI